MDFRKNTFSASEKRTIRREYNRNEELTKHPERFVVRRPSKKALKQLKTQGYTVKGRRVFIDARESKVRLNSKTGTITRKRGRRKTTEYLDAPAKVLETLPPLKKNQMVTGKLGDNPRWLQGYENVQALQKYIADFFVKGEDEDRYGEDLISQISIVEVEI